MNIVKRKLERIEVLESELPFPEPFTRGIAFIVLLISPVLAFLHCLEEEGHVSWQAYKTDLKFGVVEMLAIIFMRVVKEPKPVTHQTHAMTLEEFKKMSLEQRLDYLFVHSNRQPTHIRQ